jgi:TolB-like protein/Flp pilus assembly protein TadD
VAIRSLAVLPFKPLASGPADESLEIGIADTLITRLGNIHEVAVRPTSAVRRYTDPNQDPVAIGRQQGVDAVLDGSVQRSGDRIRVTVQLLRVQDGATLWSGKFDQQFTDIFAVEDAVSQEVAVQLAVKLNDEERARLQKRSSESIEAYEAYLKGRYFWNQRTAEGFNKAIGYFNQAISLQPNYAQAYAGLADSYLLLGAYDLVSQRQAIPKAKVAAARAVELDSTLAEAHTSLALIAENYDWSWDEAEKEFERAIELNPNYATAHHWHGEFLTFVGRPDDSVGELRRALELDPLSIIINTDLGVALFHARRYDEAINQLRKALEIDPRYDRALAFLGHSLAHKGMNQEAIDTARKRVLLQRTGWSLSGLGYDYAMAGERDEAHRVLRELSELAKKEYVSPFSIALIHGALGEKDYAFAWLEKTYNERALGLIGLKVDPRFDPLRSDLRLADLLHRMNLP